MDNHVSLVGQELTEVPVVESAYSVKQLDLSENNISIFTGLLEYKILDTLVLDGNGITAESLVESFPSIPSIKSLSLNHNSIEALDVLVPLLSSRLPSISYLTILSNPAVPSYCTTGLDWEDYRRFRLFALFHMKSLRFLDMVAVSTEELDEANRVGMFLRIARPLDHSGPEISDTDSIVSEHEEKAESEGEELSDEEEEAKRGVYVGVTRYKYVGRQSEGNRFIRNSEL